MADATVRSDSVGFHIIQIYIFIIQFLYLLLFINYSFI